MLWQRRRPRSPSRPRTTWRPSSPHIEGALSTSPERKRGVRRKPSLALTAGSAWGLKERVSDRVMGSMIRRRRTQREIPFSFDSFLDVVANVVGIILRLILVAWVGGRSYHPTVTVTPPPVVQEEMADAAEPTLPPDPIADDLERRQRELTADRDRLAVQAGQED